MKQHYLVFLIELYPKKPLNITYIYILENFRFRQAYLLGYMYNFRKLNNKWEYENNII